MMEIYKSLSVIGYPMYEVSNLGNVRKASTKQLLKFQDDGGYYRVSLSCNCKQRHFRVHRLVAIAFIPNPDNLPEVNHKDKCRTNNVVSNLEWCSGRYNLEYSNLNRSVCKYTKDGKLIAEYWSIHEAANMNGLNDAYLAKYLRKSNHRPTYKGYVWCYKGDNPVLPPKKQPKKVVVRIKMSPEEAKEKGKEYYQANKEAIKARTKEWKVKNPDKVKAMREKYKERKNYLARMRRLEKKLSST